MPVGLGVLLDVSDSMFGQRIVDARAAVERFLFTLLDPADEFFLVAFNHAPRAADAGGRSTPDGGAATALDDAATVGRDGDLRRRGERAAA